MRLEGASTSVDARLLECIELLYAGLGDLGARREFFRTLADSVGSVGAGMEFHGPDGDLVAPPRDHDAYTLEPEIVDAYVRHATLNPFKKIFAGRLTAGQVAFASDHVLLSALHDTEYWQGFMRPFDLGYPARIVPHVDGDMVAICHFAKSSGDGDFTAPERALLERITPALQNFFTLDTRLKVLELERDGAWQALDHMPCGVAVLAGNGRMLYHNATATALHRAGDGLIVSTAGIAAEDPTSERRLALAIRRALDMARAFPRLGWESGLVHVARPQPGATPYRVVVSPQRNSVAVMMHDPLRPRHRQCQRLRDLYGLTASEAEVALAIALGESLEACAAASGRAVATARNLLKRAFAKTGTSRQNELAHLLLTDALGVPLA